MKKYQYKGIGIPDKEFIRGQIPMTKENIRILSVAKMQLEEDSIVYDIGAGTGSVTVEMAFLCPKGSVYAVERKEEGCRLIEKNIQRFQLNNVTVVEGEAMNVLDSLPAPTHVFIGGSGGNLFHIVKKIREKNPKTRFVVNAITLETISALLELEKQYPEYNDMELIQAEVINIRKQLDYHMLQGNNPIYIASF